MRQLERLGNQESKVNRLEALRQDLAMSVKRLELKAGDLLIIEPNDSRNIIDKRYSDFIVELVQSLGIPRVGIMVLDHKHRVFDKLPLPTYEDKIGDIEEFSSHPEDSYLSGWENGWAAAIQAVKKVANASL